MPRLPASQCRTMTELRQQIDMLDRDLVALLAERARYIDRAAELKIGEGLPARIETRVTEVLGNVQEAARSADIDPALCVALWRQMIEWSISREEAVLGPSDESGPQPR